MTEIKKLTAELFNPSGSLGGNAAPSVIRGENAILRGGLDGVPYFENFTGNTDLEENYNLETIISSITGTISFFAGTKQINGAGTQFVEQLHYGQMLLAGGEVVVIKEIVSNTSAKVDRTILTTNAAQTAFRLPQMFEIQGKRGVLLTGNAIEIEKGHIICAGSGELYINGSVLPGTSLTASNQPQAAIYRSTTGDYIIKELGFDTSPPQPIVDVVAGGTKGMTDLNKFSMMFAYWTGTPEGTDGYSNPCEVVKLDSLAAPIKISGANNRFEINFTPSLVGIPANAKGFLIYVSLSGKKVITTQGATVSETNPNLTNYENGPWYRIVKVKLTDLDGSNKYKFEFLDGDVYELVTGNNFKPPQCEFIAKVEGRPMYISAYGKRRSGGKDEGANPGPVCLLSKAGNPDGAPPEWYASLKDIIIGFFEGAGRWWLMTPSSLDFVVPTGLIGSTIQGGTSLELPLLSRPYWKTGAANRYSITLIDDTLYGVSGHKFFRSVGNGDENVQKYEFGTPVEDITRTWSPGHEFSIEDKKNGQVLFFHSAAYQNDSGYWVTEILPFSLRNAWMPKIILSSETHDMIVSGVAVIGERVEFLAGGRSFGGTFEMKTYRFDEKPDDAGPIPYYIVWQPSDDGLENISKVLHSIRPDGRLTDFQVKIYICKPGGNIKMSDLEAGTNAQVTKTFSTTTEVTRYLRKKFKSRNVAKYTIRASGTWGGTGEPDRLEELALEISTHGRKR